MMIKTPGKLALLVAMGLGFWPMSSLASPDVDFLGWRGGASTDYWQQRTELARNLDQALPDQRPDRRLDLVRFFLANGDGAEASGLLTSFAGEDDALADVVLYRGIAAFLQKRPVVALRHLSDHRLDGSPDARLWRALVFAERLDWPSAAKEWDAVKVVLWHYPLTWQARFAAAHIDTYFGLGDIDAAARLIDQYNGADTSVIDPVAARLFQGRLLEARGALDEAVEIYIDAARGAESHLVAEAHFRALALQLETGQPDAAGLQADLKALSPLIAESRVAHEYTQLLANLALKDGQSFEALFHLRMARDQAPTRGLRQSVQTDIDHLMSQTLGSGDRDESGLIAQVEGFYAVQDLLPLGGESDQIVSAHADRLIALDLLKPAEDLLAHQVAERLTGASRARAALQLAEIRIARKDFSRALSSLNIAGYSQLGHLHSVRVKLARAKILASQKDLSGALLVLDGVDWDPALKLTADLHLQSGHAGKAVIAYRRLLDNLSVRGVSPERRDFVSERQIQSNLALAEAMNGSVAPDAVPLRRLVAMQPPLSDRPEQADIVAFTGLSAVADKPRKW